jgi:small subunit ribosomal protein S6
MKEYEGLFIFPPESGPDTRKQEISTVEGLIKKSNGSILNKAEWGRKPLGYTIKKFKEGYFLILDFQMDPSKIKELREGLQLQESLIKFLLTVKPAQAAVKKSAEKKPSIAAKMAQPTTAPH